MKILLDMNIPYTYAALLTERGIENIRWSDIGAPSAEDVEIIDYAQENDLTVLTFDLDFSAILSATHMQKPSIVQIRASVIYAEDAVDLVAAALRRYNDELKTGAILSINIKNARVRILPI